MKTRINSNYNKKVLVSGNSISDVNTLTENEMMLYTKQKDNEPVTKVVPQKIITKINGETKSYKVGGTKIIKNVGTSLVTSFRDKDVYPIYIHSINKLIDITKSGYDGNSPRPLYYDGSYVIYINNLLKKKIKRVYLLFYIPDLSDGPGGFILSLDIREDNEDVILSKILQYQQSDDYNINYLGHRYALFEIDITDKKNIIVKKASNRDIAANDYFTLDGTYYFYSPQKHQYLTLDTRFTGDKEFNSFYLFEGLVDLDRIYGKELNSPILYIPIGRIRKANHCLIKLDCDIKVPPSENWREEATYLIRDKLNYRNPSIKGFDGAMESIVEVKFGAMIPELDDSEIYRLEYFESIKFWLLYSDNTLPDSDSDGGYSLCMEKTITVVKVSI